MSEFNDPELRHELGRLSGPYPDDNAAFAAWQRRVGQARRRRAMAWTSGAALSLVVGTVAVAVLQNPTRHSVVPQKSSETSAELTVFSVASTEPETTDPSTTESTMPETTAATTVAPVTQAVAPVVETSAPEAVVEDDQGSDSQGGGTGTNKGHGTPTSAADPATSLTQHFSSAGGSITVHNDDGKLSIVATNPASGFRARENNRSGDRVRVTFRSGDQQFEITVRLKDGVMSASVADNSETQRDTVPDNTSDDDHSGRGGGDSGGGRDND